jgi:hypothetical protein
VSGEKRRKRKRKRKRARSSTDVDNVQTLTPPPPPFTHTNTHKKKTGCLCARRALKHVWSSPRLGSHPRIVQKTSERKRPGRREILLRRVKKRNLNLNLGLQLEL